MASQTNGPNGHNGQNAQELLQTLEGMNAESFGNEEERIQAVLAAYALVSRLETPWEFVARLCMSQVRTHSQISWTEAEMLSASARSLSESGEGSAAFREVA